MSGWGILHLLPPGPIQIVYSMSRYVQVVHRVVILFSILVTNRWNFVSLSAKLLGSRVSELCGDLLQDHLSLLQNGQECV